MLKTKVGEGMEGFGKEDSGGKAAVAMVSKFELLIAEMSELLKNGPVFIGENHTLDYGSDAVLALIKSGQVKKLFLELPPFPTEQTSIEDVGVPIDHITTKEQYESVKYIYTDLAELTGFFNGTTAKRYRAITECALENVVEIYHADVSLLVLQIFRKMLITGCRLMLMISFVLTVCIEN